MERDGLRRLLLVATIAALSLTALIAIVALIAADFGETELRILATRAVIGFAALSFVVELWPVWLDWSNSQDRVVRIELGTG